MKLNIRQTLRTIRNTALLLLALQPVSYAQALKPATVDLKINNSLIHAEIAATESSRNFGLMYRKELDTNNGMIFVFNALERPCFWMKNTYVPLSIAFIDQNGHITDILDMQPESMDSHCPSKPILFALELNQGWFEKNKINVGDKICLAAEIKYPAKKLGIEQQLQTLFKQSFKCN